MTATALAVFDQVLCGVDETPESHEAARQAEILIDPAGTLRCASVAERDLAIHGGWAATHLLDEIDELARGALRAAAAEVQPSSSYVLAGDPASCLLEEIRRTDSTLIAVGAGGRSRALGILLGSVATTMLHEAPCSVLVARRPTDPGAFPSGILVGVDGSRESDRAAAVAFDLAERFATDCVAVAATGGKEIDVEALEARYSELVLDRREPVDALADLAAEADLLVLGSRGLHGFGSLGSVSERVAHRAPSSVLVVR